MAKIKALPKERKFWIGELKRAKLEKPNFIDRVLRENFSGIDPKDPDAVLSAREFAENHYAHFIKSFRKWINDNYPTRATDAAEQDLFADLKSFNESVEKSFPFV